MSNTQPGAASTTKARAARQVALPPYDSETHQRLIWVYSALSSAINADILWKLHEKQCRNSTMKALIAGSQQLRADTNDCVVHARDEGQLLLCWHGTRSLEVPA
jgi:hypothetical protein